MYHNPPWQHIASPRNYGRYVQSLKLNTSPSKAQSEDSRPQNNENTLDSSQAHWLPCKDCDFPENAVLAGDYVAVARAVHLGKMIPGKAVYGFKYANIPVHYKEFTKLNYEVLINLPHQRYVWKKAADGAVPENAVIAGTDMDGEELYVARGMLGFNATCGKLKPSHKCAYLPLGGHAKRVNSYEVLCLYGDELHN